VNGSPPRNLQRGWFLPLKRVVIRIEWPLVNCGGSTGFFEADFLKRIFLKQRQTGRKGKCY
jgi:hypothetical protein